MAATALGWRARPSVARRTVSDGDDRGLVARVRAGDDAAFEAIYDRYARGLLAFCHHMLASRQDAEDALQHSFGAAYRMLRSSDGDMELRPWLYTIARNRCLSLLRARRQDISLDGVPDRAAESDGLADQVQRRSELRELLEDLRRLPDDQRAALVMFEFGGLPHDEIAAVLDVRREKVKALVFQAREGLIRARRARDLSCIEMREQLATRAGKVPRRSMLRRHVDRCPSCARFEAEVGRQRAGLALILPVLPSAGCKSAVLAAALGRGAAIAGGGAGGGAAVLGGACGGGGGLACAGVGSGAGGLTGAAAGAGAGAGGGAAGGAAAGGGAVLAGTAAGTVSGGLATAGGAGTIAAALGAKGAGGVVVKLLAVAAIGGGAAGTSDVVTAGAPTAGVAPVVWQQTASAPTPSPVIQELHAPAGRPVTDTDTAVEAWSAAMPIAGHDPVAVASSDPVAGPAPAPPTAPVPAAPAPEAPIGSLPGSGTSPGPTPAPATSQTPAPATSQTPATVQPDASSPSRPGSQTPPATLPAPASQTPATTQQPATTQAPATTPGSTAPATTTTTTSPRPPATGTTTTSGSTTTTTTTPDSGTTPATTGSPPAGSGQSAGGTPVTDVAPAPAPPSGTTTVPDESRRPRRSS